MWTQLWLPVCLALTLVLLATGISTQSWSQVALAGAAVALLLFPSGVGRWAMAALTKAPGPHVRVIALLSKVQSRAQWVLAMIAGVAAGAAWSVAANGWRVMLLAGPTLVLLLLVWGLIILREGWSGDKIRHH